MQRSVLVVIALLAVPVVQAGPWTQAGYDAARTGNVPGPGPATNDTAFRARLPGALRTGQWVGGGTWVAEPLIHDGFTYVPVVPSDSDETRDGRGIAKVDLETARAELFVELEEGASWAGIAIAGDHLLVPSRSALEAYDLETGELAWEATGSGDHLFCQAPAVGEGLVVLACAAPTDLPGRGINPEIWAVDLETRESRWNRTLDAYGRATSSDQGVPGDPGNAWSLGVSYSGDHAHAVSLECQPAFCYGQGSDSTTYTLWNLDLATGEIRWSDQTDPGIGQGNEEADNDGAYPKLAPSVTATPRAVYANIAGRLRAINPLQDQPQPIWDEELGEADTAPDRFIGPISALDGGALYAASGQSVYRFDAETGAESWRVSVALDEELVSGSLIVADDGLYTLAHHQGFDHATAYAFDAETGAPSWSHTFLPRAEEPETRYSFAVGEGAMVVAGTDATLRVIGSTAASLGAPEVQPSTTYPAVGEELRVDLSGTEPGAFGPATRYKAYWGDGNVTGWQSDPVLTHTYDEPGNHTARIVAGNDANQTASTTQTFHVGQDPPPKLNFMQKAFAPENQDMTFGIIGIALAAAGGAWSLAKRRRKRSRLQDELETLEQGFEETRDTPHECEAFLDERKARARSLLMDGVLTEEQFGVVETRAEDLRRKLRKGALEEEFGFLPHVLVVRAREMLEDGKVSTLEAEAFLAALDEVQGLSEVQEALVRERVEDWYERDVGGGAG